MADVIKLDLNLADTNASRTPSRDEAERRFWETAADVGLDPRDVHFGETDGIVRCDTVDDKAGRRSGWYVIHREGDIYYGALGNWRSDMHYVKFTGRDERLIDSDTLRTIQIKQEQRRIEEAEMRRRNAVEASMQVQALSNRHASNDHPYLVRKRIKAHGALALGQDLLLPISDLDGNVVSTQTISPDGDKSFRTGCTSKGVYVIGAPTPNYVICEGFATGASIHEATGMRVYVTFNAGNMAAMAGDIACREAAHGGAKAVIAADHDRPNSKGDRVGILKAEKAAEAAGGAMVKVPPTEGDDWNDVAIRAPSELAKAFGDVRPLMLGWEMVDEAKLPRRQWLYANTYIRKFCSMTVAPGGLGKSTLVLAEGVSMATGKPILGITPEKNLRVGYINIEDPLDEIKARVVALCKAYRIDQRELSGRLFIQSGRDADIKLATGAEGNIVEAMFQMISGFVRYNHLDVLIIDPLANAHDSDETNEVYRKLGRRLSMLADECNMAIHIVHHTRKLNGFAANVEDSRGGSALVGAVRVARALNPMSNEEAEKYGLATGIDHFRVEPAGKNNLARPSDKAEWFERFGVQLTNGDWVAAVKTWQVPNPFDGVTPEHVQRVQRMIRVSDIEWRESVQANDWVGKLVAEVLDVDLEEAGAKRKIKVVLAEWIKNDVLRVETRRDKGKGRDVQIVVCGDN